MEFRFHFYNIFTSGHHLNLEKTTIFCARILLDTQFGF
jgi:hypothetical protein